MTKYLQGKYIVRNKKKYMGDHNNVVYRSSWELNFQQINSVCKTLLGEGGVIL